jgi:toxin-antitoxin system PIN domain toxin
LLIPDVNLILNASLDDWPFHASARGWFEDAQAGNETVGIPDFILVAVVRISTNPRVLRAPLSIEQALGICDAWRAIPQFRALNDGPRRWQTFRDLTSRVNVTGPAVTDAYIAALAMHHNATLVTFDRGFSRYPGLMWIQPGS